MVIASRIIDGPNSFVSGAVKVNMRKKLAPQLESKQEGAIS